MLQSNYASQDVAITPPTFKIDNGILSFLPGATFVRVDKHPDLARHPLRIPFQSQLQIEMLRRYFSSPDHNYIALWEPYLKLAEQAVKQALDDIAANKDAEDDLRTKLEGLRAEIEGILQDAVLKFAVQNNLNIAQDDQIRGKLVKVLFQSDPVGAEIYIVGGFLYKAAGKSPDESLWLDVSHGNEVNILVGDWHYRTRWEKDNPWQTSLIQINKEGTYKITRKPK